MKDTPEQPVGHTAGLLVEFPTERTRAACYACFDFAAGDKACPACGRGLGSRMAVERRPARPSMFPEATS